MGVVFLGSFLVTERLPNRKERKIAFLGRSNVGKSSLINLLTGAQIARISKAPGRTQAVNLYEVDQKWIFGDFPGYGFARVSRKERKQFELLIEKFLTAEYFEHAIQIVDARHPGMEMDLQLHKWLSLRKLPHHIVLNKVDKLNQRQKVEAERQARKTFAGQPLLFASTFTKEGKRELEKILQELTADEHR